MSTYKLTENEGYLLDEIKEYTKDTHSDNYYTGKIKQLGEGLVREVLSETRYKHRQGDIKKTPKEYLTYLLEQEKNINNKISLFKASSKPTKTIGNKAVNESKFLNILTTTKEVDKNTNVLFEEKLLTSPRELDQFLKVTILTSSKFFTQTTNSKKTEKIVLMNCTINGENKNLILVKGKAFRNGEARGLLKAFHSRVLYALTSIWEEHGKQYLEYLNHEIKTCFCNVSIKELTNILGFKNSHNLGGRQYTKIKKAIDDLNTIPFYFDFSEFGKKLKNITFKFLQTAIFPEYKGNNTSAMIRIEFSQLYSNMLTNKQTVRRNKVLCTIKNSLTFLLLEYIEPILVKVGCFETNLTTLIKSMDLNNAKWHNFKSDRRKEFKRITESKDFKNFILSNGSTMAPVKYCSNKDKNDYLMKITTSKAKRVIDTTCQLAI